MQYGSSQFRHDGDISSIAVSPDGRLVAASASLPDDTAIWDVETGERRVTIDAPATSLAWSADGLELTLAFAWTSTHRAKDGSEVARIAEVKAPMALSPSGRIAGQHDESGHLWLQGVGTIPIVADGSVVFDGEGERLVVCAREGSPAFVVGPDGSVITEVGNGVTCACFVGLSDRLLLLGDSKLVCWNLRTFEREWSMKTSMERRVVASASGRWAAVNGHWDNVDLVDVHAGRRRRLEGAQCTDGALAFLGDEVLLIGNRHRIALHDLPSGKERPAAIGHDRSVRMVAVARAAPVVATAGGDNTARTWDLHTGESRGVFAHDNAVCAIALSADGTEVLTSAADDLVRLWGAGGALVRSFESDERHFLDAKSVAFSPSDRFVVCDVEEGALIWDREVDHRYTLELPWAVLAVDFFDDEHVVLLTKGTITICTFVGEVVARHSSSVELKRLAVARADSLIVVADDREVTHGLRYAAGSLDPVFRFETGYGVSLAASEDGLVATGHPSSIELYDHVAGAAAGSVPVDHTPRTIAFVPGEHSLVVGWPNGTASRISLPTTPRQYAERMERARAAEVESAVALLHELADRRAPAGYRGGTPTEGLDDDGLGLTLERAPRPVKVRLSVDAPMRLSLRCGDPTPEPEDDGLLARIGRWWSGDEDDGEEAFLRVFGSQRNASLRAGPRGAEVTLDFEPLPELDTIRAWVDALAEHVAQRVAD